MEHWLPTRPDLTPAERDYWHEWARTARSILGSIKQARAWRPVRECPTCVVEGRQPPREGCQNHHPYVDWTPNLWQTRLFYTQAHFQAFTVGNRGGKSNGAAMRIMLALTSIPPAWFLDEARVDLLPLLPWPRSTRLPRKVWVGGTKRENLEKGVVKYVVQALDGTAWMHGDPVYYAGPGGKRYVKEIEVGMGGVLTGHMEVKLQDQGIAAFMSDDIDLFVEDEEFEGETGDDIRLEARNRTSDRQGYYLFNVTAVNTAIRGGQSWIAQHVLSPCLKGGGDMAQEDDGFTYTYSYRTASTYENTHMTEAGRRQHDLQNRDLVTGEKTDWWRVRVEGAAIGVNLSQAFLNSSLEWMLGRARAPIARGRLVDAQTWRLRTGHSGIPAWNEMPGERLRPTFERDDRGHFTAWWWPDAGEEYVVGADVGNGLLGGNPSAAWVLARRAGRFVACLHGLIDTTTFADALVRLAWFYNHAYLNVEIGGPGVAVVSHLGGIDTSEPRYDRLYLHNRPGGYESVNGRLPGYPALKAEKEYWVSVINAALNPETPGDPSTIPIVIPCAETLGELMGGFRDEKGIIDFPSVPHGSMVLHGDRGVAIGMALVAHNAPNVCPLSIITTPRTPHADPRTEAVILEFEKEDALRRVETEGWAPMDDGVDYFVADSRESMASWD